MRIIDEISRKYPSLDMESIRILLTIHEHPGFCVREVADVLALDHKTVQIKIALMASGRENRNSSKHNFINTNYKTSDKRKRDLMLTSTGQDLAIKLKFLGALVFRPAS